jgi:hypothetical protein
VSPASSAVQLKVVGYDPITQAAVTGSSLPYGSIVAGAVTLSGVSGQIVPSGTVSYFRGSNKLADVLSSADGQASYSATGYGLGSYTWTASYAGNNNYSVSTSSAIAFTVAQASTVTKLLANTSYVVGSGSATVTAIVGADSLLLNPSGTIVFSVNGKSIGSVAVTAYTDPATGASYAKGSTNVAASSFAAGSNSLTASYSGDGNYGASSSSVLSIGYSATAPVNAITFTASPVSATSRQPVTLSAAVATGGIPATAGTVEFFDGATSLGTAQVAGSVPAKGYTTGTAVLKIILAPGEHSLTAKYRGILAAPTAVTATAVSVTVAGSLPASIALAAQPGAKNSANYDLTATVTGFGFQVPTATVDFTETSVVQDFGGASLDSANAAHTFLAPAYLTSGDSSGAGPAASVVADLNGDGIPDIATPNASFTEGTVSVLIGNGDGTFQKPVTYPTGIFAESVAVGDFNNDGILDLAVTCQYNSSFSSGLVSILLGNGDGTFQPQIPLNLPGFPVGTSVGDFNRDGILDVASVQFSPLTLVVAFGNGDGTFQSPASYDITASNFSPYAMAAGDFNGDGALDIAEANSSDGTVGVFLNNGDGTFAAKGYVSVTDPQWITVADTNGDGKQDMLVSDYSDETVVSLLGNGDGTFTKAASYTMAGFPASLAVADLDGDGKTDLVAGFFYPQIGVGVLHGNGDGTFGKETDYATGQGHGYAVTLGDLNGDGTPDLISADINVNDSASQNLAILLNVTQSQATVSNASVAGPDTTQQELQSVYSGDNSYVAASSPGIYVKGSGTMASPVILWSPASPWGSGVALGTSVLNATVNGNIAGVFSYTAQPSSGTATAVTGASTLTAGSYTIAATFMPVDSSSYSTVSATRTVVIEATDFTVQTGTSSLSISAGGSGSLTLTVPALYGFTGTVAISGGSSLPGGFTVTASPSSVAAGGSTTVTIQTSGLSSSAANHQPTVPWGGFLTGGVALSCLICIPLVRKRKSAAWLMVVGIVSLFSVLNGCGGGSSITAPTVTLATSSNKSASGSGVTLTAAVASRHSHPGGSITFYNGSTALGSPVSVVNGSASLSVSSLPVGLDSLTAVYSGDVHNSGATSKAISELVTGQTSIQIAGAAGSLVHLTTVQVTLQ